MEFYPSIVRSMRRGSLSPISRKHTKPKIKHAKLVLDKTENKVYKTGFGGAQRDPEVYTKGKGKGVMMGAREKGKEVYAKGKGKGKEQTLGGNPSRLLSTGVPPSPDCAKTQMQTEKTVQTRT